MTLRIPHTRIEAWRDVDSESPRLGFILRLRGADLYLGRRLYRVLWAPLR